MQKARLIYPLLVAAIASLLWPSQANSNSPATTPAADTLTGRFAEVKSVNESGNQSMPAEGAPALLQVEPTAVNGYPGPTETSPVAKDSYPAVQSSPQPAYPAASATFESGSPPVSVIGEQNELLSGSETAASNRQVRPRQAVQGRVFLWGGFIVALLLFITAVVGSIVLFTHRRG